MSKINRIRIMNLNYNGNTIRIDDETFDLGGETTLLSLRNGGGKTVLVQMITSLFVNKKYRDFGDRAFKNYFTTNRPTIIMTEWSLDYGQGYFLVGMMVRKAQNSEMNNDEELEMITFTGSYKDACEYDMDNIALISYENGNKVLKGFGVCKQEFERLKKEKKSDFSYYDMSQAYQRRSYFSKLKEYQINNKEWETIIKQVNLKESGLSELFSDARDEKGLVEKWFLRAVENKLDQESNRIKNYQDLTYKFVRQYRENQSKITKKDNINQYFSDAAVIQEKIDEYITATDDVTMQQSNIAVFIKNVDEMVNKLNDEFENINIEINDAYDKIRRIDYERLSYNIHELDARKDELKEREKDCETRIIEAQHHKNSADKELNRYDCAKKYGEVKKSKEKLDKLQEKLRIKKEEDAINENERNELGSKLYLYYTGNLKEYESKTEDVVKKVASEKAIIEQLELKKSEEYKNLEELAGKIGAQEVNIKNYNNDEDKFNSNYDEHLARNILGEYEEGALDVLSKTYQDKYLETKTITTRLAEERIKLNNRDKELERNIQALIIEQKETESEVLRLETLIDRFNYEIERRKLILKYVELSEEELDNKNLICERLVSRIKELELIQDEYKIQRDKIDRELRNLKDGKLMELPENITSYFDTNNIDYVYGMEWIKRNGRSEKDNTAFIDNNPFIPYSIILNEKDLEVLRSSNEEIYTKFPIPIIVREHLEETVLKSKNSIIELENINFMCLFNKHLLNAEELKKMIASKQELLEKQKEKIAVKNDEIDEYRSYYNEVNGQEYSKDEQDKTLKLIQDNKELQSKIEDALRVDRNERNAIEEKLEDNEKKNNQNNADKLRLEHCIKDFEELCNSYNRYLEALELKNRCMKKQKDANNKIEELTRDILTVQGNIRAYEAEKNSYEIKKEEYKKEAGKYAMYEGEIFSELDERQDIHKKEVSEKEQAETDACTDEVAGLGNVNSNSCIKSDKDIVYKWKKYLGPEFDISKATVRYDAITNGIASSIKELEADYQAEQETYNAHCSDLEEGNYHDFTEEDYKDVVISKDIRKNLKNNKDVADREENAAKEAKNKVSNEMGAVNAEYKIRMEELQTNFETDILVEKAEIVDTDFPKRKKLADYELKQKNKSKSDIESRLNAFKNNQTAMMEFREFDILEGTNDIILDNYTKDELDSYQGELKRTLKNRVAKCEKLKNVTKDIIQDICKKTEYQDDFFKKGFDNCIEVIDNASNLNLQLNTTIQSYRTILEKLEVDLANVDRERANVQENFMDYIKEIDDNLRKIDKNSAITIRGRNIKMLKITVPSWEDNVELYTVKLRDYIDNIIKRGLEVIEQNGNVEELLGKLITSKRLYDEIVGIGNIGIRLYKVEVEREVPISWQEVASNSGGEGFLSAFIVLSCLLSYMRRDDTDIFATGEEGKVLIMDNPFAQTNAEHLLKPLMEMAKKTNTQLICLSGLGGDSIYNRFDNIYVLNIEQSSLRKGLSYMETKHVKGDDIKKMVLSQFKVEQISLFD